jgi:hypothetical protein
MPRILWQNSDPGRLLITAPYSLPGRRPLCQKYPLIIAQGAQKARDAALSRHDTSKCVPMRAPTLGVHESRNGSEQRTERAVARER